MQLQPFQHTAIDFFRPRNFNGILADSMGLFKSTTAIGMMEAINKGNTLILCPAIGKRMWATMLQKWGNTQPVTVIGEDIMLHNYGIFIVNYDILHNWHTGIEFNTLIMDEFHLCKSKESIRGCQALTKAEVIPHKIFLSGTPMTDRPRDLFLPLFMLRNQLPTPYNIYCSSFKTFTKRYCAGFEMQVGNRTFWNTNGVSNAEELNEILNLVMIRRKTEDVMEMPQLTRTLVYCGEDEMPVKNTAFAEKYRLYSIIKKIPKAVEMIKELPGKVGIGVHHQVAINEIKKLLPDSYVIIGQTDPKTREYIENRFREDDTRYLIGSMSSCNTTVNFSAANKVCVLEWLWSPDIIEQFIKRFHRYPQTKQVDAYFFSLKGGIDEKMLKINSDKQDLFDRIVEGKVSTKELFNQYITK